MNILLTGATGLIGTELGPFLSRQNHRVIRMVRSSKAGENEVLWDPHSGTLNPQHLEGIDAVVHLAGENISSGRWTERKKRRILESRVQGTRLLAQSIAHLFDPPKVFVSISAIGYYGDRKDETLTEESDPGTGFLPHVCAHWESATQAAISRGIRVVIPRLGMVLSSKGGAMGFMLPVFRLGIGGKIGNGRQYQSWIALDDVLGVIDHALHTDSLQGPVNAVSPDPVTNRDFSLALGRALSRPARLALPAFAARIAFGRMADEVLLASARVAPVRLAQSGYKFRFSELNGALQHILKRSIV